MKKKLTPKQAKAMEEIERQEQAFDRWLNRLFRAAAKCKKLRSSIRYQLRKLRAEQMTEVM